MCEAMVLYGTELEDSKAAGIDYYCPYMDVLLMGQQCLDKNVRVLTPLGTPLVLLVIGTGGMKGDLLLLKLGNF